MGNSVLLSVREGTFTDEEVLSAAKEIGLYRSSIIVPGKDRPDLLVSVDTDYSNKTWNEAHSELRKEGYFMLAPRYFVEFLNHLRSGNKVYDGRKRKLDSSRVDTIIKDIIIPNYPWRTEWLDARFGRDTITYHKIKTDGAIEEVTESLGDYLMEDRTPGIDLYSWLSNPTVQGFPGKDIVKGEFFYNYSRDGTVAWFWKTSGAAGLYCNKDPQDPDYYLKVRRAKIFEQ